MALEIELWWHSRANKSKQEFSIYADILDLFSMLPEEFSSIDGEMRIGDLDKRNQTRTGYVSVSIDDLPQSRREDWKQSDLRRSVRRGWKENPIRLVVLEVMMKMSRKQRHPDSQLQHGRSPSIELGPNPSLLARSRSRMTSSVDS